MLPRELYRAEQVRRLDAAAIEQFGIPGLTLMKRAAAACLHALRTHWPDIRDVVVVAGNGNNAGDAYLVALNARRAGLRVRTIAVGDPNSLSGDAALAFAQFQAAGLVATPWEAKALAGASLVVDGLFGTGLNRPLVDVHSEAVVAINGSSAPVLAIDLPSGLDADTGCVLGQAVKASVTVSFIGLKQGMFTGQGREYCGEVLFDSLDVPGGVFESEAVFAHRTGLTESAAQLGPRPRAGHKGTFGHVLLIGGNLGYSGAIRLAAEAAGRTGAGLVSVATHPANVPIVSATTPELMVRGVESPADLASLLGRADVLVAGPGFGQDDWAREMLSQVMAWVGPRVLDADALNLIANMDFAPALGPETVLTPHPAEAGRLLGLATAKIEADRFAAARALVDRFAAVSVLKGAGTLVACAAPSVAVCEGGNPGMASGGMGDVLSGIIGALQAQGLSAFDAACVGVCVHARAGDLAARAGERGLLASDLIPLIRCAVNPGQTEA